MSRKKKNNTPWQDDALEAVRTLRAGGVILHKSDTVWGVACDATNPEAVSKLRKLKMRDDASPILVLVADNGLIERHFSEIPDAAWDLFEHSNRPTTVIMPGAKGVDPSILGPDDSLGIRLIQDEWTQFVARGLARPLASSSANLTGSPTPINYDSISPEILNGADFTSLHRRSELESSSSSFIAAFDTSGRFKILRS
jgi:L-threonylcarbamoyladenylate synthase|tara:strand:- start:155 stop:748 length:594 start_codon:yes stop_codon:yes gene_type:complete